jgi:hypothetical protein
MAIRIHHSAALSDLADHLLQSGEPESRSSGVHPHSGAAGFIRRRGRTFCGVDEMISMDIMVNSEDSERFDLRKINKQFVELRKK